MSDKADLATVDLVSRARRGETSAFEALIRRHERLALGVAYGMLQDAPLAGDIVQEAFVKAWRRLGDLAQAGSFASWLCGIVRNLCVDVRRRKRIAVCGIEEARGEPDGRSAQPPDEINRRETCQEIAAALSALDEITRSAMVLRYYENLSSRQIGELLGLSPAAVDMRLMRGRQTMKQKLSPREVDV